MVSVVVSDIVNEVGFWDHIRYRKQYRLRPSFFKSLKNVLSYKCNKNFLINIQNCIVDWKKFWNWTRFVEMKLRL